MRVVAGGLKGRIIKAPEGRGTRPSTDRVRESMFSSLFSRVGDLDGLCVLDAFAGSGALGIEALSRGAASCVFFEVDGSARKVLADNLQNLGLTGRARVVADDVFETVRTGRISFSSAPFDIVFADPPYAFDAHEVAVLIEGLASSHALARGAVVVYEHARDAAISVEEAIARVAVLDFDACKIYGKTAVTYARFRDAGDDAD